MSVAGVTVLAVALLADPVDRPAAAEVPAPAKAPAAKAPQKAPQKARITSRTCDLDMKAGVALFEGDVAIRSSDGFTLCAEKLYAFSAGSNELSRIVAIGAVSITNGARVGTCEMATYRRWKGQIEMFGDGKGKLAGISEGDAARTLTGTRIRFWLDSEEVEVENSTVTSERKDGVKLL